MMEKLPDMFIFPGKLHATMQPYYLKTILGSCVAICLWDKKKQFGGMNHYMLPLWNGNGLPSPKFGNIAIEKLINRMKFMGSEKEDLVAKVFGGGKIMNNNGGQYAIGERNIEIAKELLEKEGIKIIKSSTGGTMGRKIIMNTHTFEIYHKFIEKT